jgi:hypothetical protein
LQLVKQPVLLPIGALRGAQADQDVVGGKRGERILEREHRVVGPYRSTRVRSQLLDLTKNRLKALISLLARLVGCRGKPLEPSWQGRRYDQHLIGVVDEFTDAERQRVRAVGCLTGCDQQSLGHRT